MRFLSAGTVIMTLGFLACASTLTGCSTAPSPTHGYALGLRVSEPATNKFYYYDLSKAGELRFITGLRATTSEPGAEAPTWSGKFTEAELAATVKLLSENPEPQKVQPEANQPNYRVAITPPDAGMFSRIMLVSGPTPFITELERGITALMWSKRQRELQSLMK